MLEKNKYIWRQKWKNILQKFQTRSILYTLDFEIQISITMAYREKLHLIKKRVNFYLLFCSFYFKFTSSLNATDILYLDNAVLLREIFYALARNKSWPI